MFKSTLVLDSISEQGVRLVTMEMTYPLIGHNEDLRHRTPWKTASTDFDEWLDASRSVASNRALAPSKIREAVVTDPYIPQFVESTRGMTGGKALNEADHELAVYGWLKARDDAVKWFDYYETLPGRVHKQHRNRLLGPFQWVTVVSTANAIWWESFFALRDHVAAQPDIAIVAKMGHEQYLESTPQVLRRGEWHMPFVDRTNDPAVLVGWNLDTARKVSVARCARTSYLRQNEKLEVRDDLQLYNDLISSVPPHDGPREHVCTPIDPETRSGNLVGWTQLRHFV